MIYDQIRTRYIVRFDGGFKKKTVIGFQSATNFQIVFKMMSNFNKKKFSKITLKNGSTDPGPLKEICMNKIIA